MNHNKPVIQQQEEPSFTSFNVQSSAFFNNHLSSKSSDANDFLTLQLKTQSKVSMKSNHSQGKRKFNMLVGNKYNNTMSTVNNSNSSNIGNVNFIQMNNYMFTPQTAEMYMKQQNMYNNNQYGYPNYGNMYQQQQYPMQYGYMKPKGKSNHYG